MAGAAKQHEFVGDLFSTQSSYYNAYRPTYPKELFDFLASLTTHHDLALDVATGNGQAAVTLAEYYKTVIATDGSASQIEHALRTKSNVTYKCLPAEMTDEQMKEHDFKPASFDLITSATAAHFFDHEKFNKVVQKLLKPTTGIICHFSYQFPEFDDSRIFGIITQYYDMVKLYTDQKIRDYWYDQFQSIPFPYAEIKVPRFNGRTDKLPFDIVREPNLDDYLGYLYSTATFRIASEKLGYDVVAKLRQELLPFWGNEDTRHTMRWPVYARVGRLVS